MQTTTTFCLWFFAHPPLLLLTDSSASGSESARKRSMTRVASNPLNQLILKATTTLCLWFFAHPPLLRLTDSSTLAGGSESARKKALAKWLLTLKSADPICNDDLFACGSLLVLLLRLTDSSTSGLSRRMSNLQRRLNRRTERPPDQSRITHAPTRFQPYNRKNISLV